MNSNRAVSILGLTILSKGVGARARGRRGELVRRGYSAVAALLVLVWPGPARADVVLDWNGLAAQLIVGPGGANKVPPLGLVDLAIVHTAMYDAVNAVEGFPFEPYGVPPTVTTPASAEAAAAQAGRDVLLALYPSRSADIEALYASSLASVPDGPAEANGVDVGQQAAAGILALRANDGRNAADGRNANDGRNAQSGRN